MESSGVFFSPPSPLRGRTPLTPLFEGGMQKSPVSTVLDLYLLETKTALGAALGNAGRLQTKRAKSPQPSKSSRPCPFLHRSSLRSSCPPAKPSKSARPSPFLHRSSLRSSCPPAKPSKSARPSPFLHRSSLRSSCPPPSAAMAQPSAAMARRAQQRRKRPLHLKLSLYSGLPFPQRGKGWG